jgi:hypothetical protein
METINLIEICLIINIITAKNQNISIIDFLKIRIFSKFCITFLFRNWFIDSIMCIFDFK